MTERKAIKRCILNKGLKVWSYLVQTPTAAQWSVFGYWFLILEDHITANTHTHTHMNIYMNTQQNQGIPYESF